MTWPEQDLRCADLVEVCILSRDQGELRVRGTLLFRGRGRWVRFLLQALAGSVREVSEGASDEADRLHTF